MDVACLRCYKAKDVTEFYADNSRSNGVDSWCKECRKKWRRTTLRKSPLLYSKDPYINLYLPASAEWPKTCLFSSGTRKIADELVKANRIVVVTKQSDDSPVWFWRKWGQAAFNDFFDFYAWLTKLPKS